MSKEDLTGYTDQELSLRVFNTEFLYNVRRLSAFRRICEDRFTFTDKQWAITMQDVYDDWFEEAEL